MEYGFLMENNRSPGFELGLDVLAYVQPACEIGRLKMMTLLQWRKINSFAQGEDDM